ISGFIVSRVAVRSVANDKISAGGAARNFLTRRITRIFPLYWLLTFVVLLEAELGRYKIKWHLIHWMPTVFLFPSLPWSHPASNIPALSLGWSLMFEMYFYLILTVFMAWTPRSLVRNTVAFLCGMVILGTLVNIHRPLIVIWMNPIVLEFVFGCLIGLIFSRSTV